MTDKTDRSDYTVIDKLKEIVSHPHTCLFSTYRNSVQVSTHSLAVREVCDEGNFWFMTFSNEEENIEIKTDSRIQLMIWNVTSYEFLSVYGRATISGDQQRIKKYLRVSQNELCSTEKNDSRIIIKVTPEKVFYRATNDSKVESLLTVAIAIDGEPF